MAESVGLETGSAGKPIEVFVDIPNLSEKDDQLVKEFERIERGMRETLEAKSASLRAAMARSWKERAGFLWANAALADSPWIREGMSRATEELRDEFGEILEASELAKEPSMVRRWSSRFGMSGGGPKDPDPLGPERWTERWTVGTAVKDTIASAGALPVGVLPSEFPARRSVGKEGRIVRAEPQTKRILNIC